MSNGGGSADLAILGGQAIRKKRWPAWPAYDEETGRVLLDVMRSERWALSGPYRGGPCYERRFAEAFAQYHATSFCTPVTNGSAGLAIALRALDVGYGDRVVVPGLTWIACATSVTSVGALPIPIDIELDTLCISLSDLEQQLAKGVSAVILVHPFCTVADLTAVGILCKRYNTPLIEDCSQAHGAEWLGRKVGTFGSIGVFSMQQSKVLTAGEGGAIITRDEGLAKRIEQLRADGRVFSACPELHTLELSEVGDVQGRNHCLSEFQAAVLLSRLPHLDAENSLRRANARLLDTAVKAVAAVIPLRQKSEVLPTYYNYVFRIDRAQFSGKSVQQIARALTAELQIQVSPIYRPLPQHRLFQYKFDPVVRDLQKEYAKLAESFEERLSNCLTAFDSYLSIPHPALLGDSDDIDDILLAIHKVQRGAEALPEARDGAGAF